MHFYEPFAQKGNGYCRFFAATLEKIHFYVIIGEKETQKEGRTLENAEIRGLAADFDISKVINCYSAELSRARKFYARRRTRHAFVLFTGGCSRYYYGRNEFEMGKYRLLYMPKGVDYYICHPEDCFAYILDFDSPSAFLPPPFAVTCDAGTERLFSEAVSYFASDQPDRTAKIKSIFYRIIVTVTDILCTPGYPSPSAKRLLPAIERIKSGFADPSIRIDDLARLSGLGKKHFTSEFVQVYGDTPGQYIISLRIDMACRLLTRTDLSVKEIAERCGFNSEYYFSRIFSAKTAYSPTAYRKNFRNV